MRIFSFFSLLFCDTRFQNKVSQWIILEQLPKVSSSTGSISMNTVSSTVLYD